MTENQSRLPTEYEIPEVVGNYFKPKNGTTKLRIMSEPVIGRQDREEYKDDDGKTKKRSLHFRMDEKPEVVHEPKGLKHFRATVVWNYELEALQLRTITQKSIMNAIIALTKDEDFADIYAYDIKLGKK